MTYGSVIKNVLINNSQETLENINKERVHTFDFVRGLAVFFMVFVHVLGIYSNFDVQDSAFGYVVDFLGSPPAAPVFMFSMGVFFILSSRNSTLNSGLKRGVLLLLLGSLLSFLRHDLLQVVQGTSTFAHAYNTRTLTAIWEVDILQFAGCAYILLSLIKHYIKKPIVWVLLAVIILLASPLLWGITTGNPFLDWILQFFIGAADDIYFPIFPWLIYPLLGMVFGLCMKSYPSFDLLMNDALKLGLILLLLGSIWSLSNLDFHIGDYFRSGPGSVVWITGFIQVWLYISNKFIQKNRNSKFVKTINYWGRETTTIYFIHWILIMWFTLFLGVEHYGIFETITLTIFFITGSSVITHLYKKHKQHTSERSHHV